MSNYGPNTLTVSDFDPVSRQPELKHAVLQIEKVELPWEMVIMRRGDAVRRMQAVQHLLRQFPYATVTLFGRDEPALIFRAHASSPPDPVLIQELDLLLGLDDDSRCLVYVDRKRGISKRVLVGEAQQIDGVRLTGETVARDWLKALMQEGVLADEVRPWVLAPVATPPAGSQSSRGRIICNCWDVSENEIRAELQQGCDLAGLQQKLKCGTQCGSCVPEIKRIIQLMPA